MHGGGGGETILDDGTGRERRVVDAAECEGCVAETCACTGSSRLLSHFC